MIITDLLHILKMEKIAFFYKGEKNINIKSISPIYDISKNGMSFWNKDNTEIFKSIQNIANIVIITRMGTYEHGINYIFVENPRSVFFHLLNKIPYYYPINDIDIYSNSVLFHDKCTIGKNSFISEETKMGECINIGSNVTISGKVILGDNVTIESGARIGVDSCSFYVLNGKKYKVPHFAGVIIGSNVFIGANTVIVKGTLCDTFIGNNVGISALCYIGHNTKIFDNVSITGSCTIAGSVTLKNGCRIHPNSSIGQGIEIGTGSLVGIGSTVIKNVGDGEIVVGNPAHFLRYVSEADKQKFPLL